MNGRTKKAVSAVHKAFYDLLMKNKYDSISVKDIVSAANVGRTTFYKYFSTKEQLLNSMMEEFCIPMFESAHKSCVDNLYANKAEMAERFCCHLFKEAEIRMNNIKPVWASPNFSVVSGCFEKHLCQYITKGFTDEGDETVFLLVKYIAAAFVEALVWRLGSAENTDYKEVYNRYRKLTGALGKNPVNNERRVTTNRSNEDIAKKFKDYINALEFLSRTTDDFLYLYDIPNREVRFFGNISKDYPLSIDERGVNPIDDFINIIYPVDSPEFKKEINYLEEGITDTHDVNFRVINRKKKIVWMSSRGKVIYDEYNKPYVLIGRMSEEALRHLFNPITGLFNKVKLKEDLKRDFGIADSGYLMLLEICDLAAVNLSYGRQYGDGILKDLSVMMENYNKVDKVYHVDTGVFAVLLNNGTEKDASDLFNSIKASIQNKCMISAGVVPMNSALYIDETGMIDSVKLTLAKAKANGESVLEFFSPEQIKQSIYNVELLDELQSSIDNDYEGFSVQYQPQLVSGSYKLYGAESLMRYNSKRRGPISPMEFIPVLEQSGLINNVGLWILEQAVVTCKKWQKYMPDFHISVNFSTVQFKDPAIYDKIMHILDKHNLSGSSLSVEITESIPFSELGRFNTISRQLKNDGIQISIDDFGTGYSNLAYLKDFDIDEIKIDRMFVKGIEEDTYNYNLISNTVEFAKANSIRICCEGVETPKELTVLEALSSDLFQGYLFDRPCDPVDFEEIYFDKTNIKYTNRLNLIKELYEYKERKGFVRFNPKEILRDTGVGLWIIRINPETAERELHVDETMETLLGIDKKYLPDECYNYWFDRIQKDFVEYVSVNVRMMAESTNGVQIEYKWQHPEKGEVTMRSTGKRGRDSDGMVVIEGYHRIFTGLDVV